MTLVITEFMYAEFVSGTLEFQSQRIISYLDCSLGCLSSCSVIACNEAANLLYGIRTTTIISSRVLFIYIGIPLWTVPAVLIVSCSNQQRIGDIWGLLLTGIINQKEK